MQYIYCILIYIKYIYAIQKNELLTRYALGNQIFGNERVIFKKSVSDCNGGV